MQQPGISFDCVESSTGILSDGTVSNTQRLTNDFKYVTHTKQFFLNAFFS